MFCKYLIVFLAISSNIICQPIKTYLDTLTKSDDNEIHLVTLSADISEKLVLPKLPIGETSVTKKYLNLFYSWDVENDEKISVLVYQFKNEDLLYIDRNNDNDLTNDGAPILFPLEKDSITFYVTAQNDKNQRLKLALFRKPDIADTLIKNYLDSEGNLSSRYFMLAKGYSNDFNYKGEKRSFYFDYRITLRKGKLKIGDSTYLVGLFDFTNNGLFNDKRDLFLIDINNNGKLNIDIPSNVFAIDDVFQIGKKNYKLTEINKYGKYFVVSETSEKPKYKYLKWIQKESSKNQKKGILTPEFWRNKLVTLNNGVINLSDFKGKYIFLNIWGEWCLPCINEIEELKKAYENYKDKVIFLGVMKVNDIKKAKKLIKLKGIIWENTFISDKMIKRFGVKGYPTNILIYPDSKNYIKEHGINHTFFDMNVK